MNFSVKIGEAKICLLINVSFFNKPEKIQELEIVQIAFAKIPVNKAGPIGYTIIQKNSARM